MTMRRGLRPSEQGFTLIELLISMVVLSLVMGVALSMMRSQSRNFRVGGSKMELTQNIRYALGTVERAVRTTGAGTAPNQPMLVYGANDVVTFNANFASDIQDGNAVYVNPNLPAGGIDALPVANAIVIPTTAVAYPAVNYFYSGATPSRAETISFYFQLDATTADPADYVLFERINALPPEMVARNIQAYPGRPFFEYFAETTNAGGLAVIQQITAARVPASQALPIRHSANLHGSGADINGSALADSVRMIRINAVVSNGLAGTEAASRQVSTMIPLPNNGLAQLKTCGDAPVLTGALTATNVAGLGGPTVRFQWPRSGDELSGEQDIAQYNLYYRQVGFPDWNTMVTVVPTAQANYDVLSGAGLTAGLSYQFAVTAQDCTPQESPQAVSGNVNVVP